MCCLTGCNQRQPTAVNKQNQITSSNTQQPDKRTALPLDDVGRTITLSQVPQRIVTIGPGVTETVFALGAGERLVGRDQVSDYPSGKFPRGVGGIPFVADYSGPFFEKVVAVRPDFIIAQGETLDKARLDTWQQKCGAPVAVVGAHTVEQVAQDIEKIGAWLGKVSAAGKLAGAIRVVNKAPDTAGPRVFFEVSRAPLWTAGSGTLVDDVLRAAGCTNIARDVQSYQQYNLEVLAAKNPTLYILAQQKPDVERAIKELRKEPTLKNLDCIRAGRVIVLPSDLVLRPGPRLGQGIKMLRDRLRAMTAPVDVKSRRP